MASHLSAESWRGINGAHHLFEEIEEVSEINNATGLLMSLIDDQSLGDEEDQTTSDNDRLSSIIQSLEQEIKIHPECLEEGQYDHHDQELDWMDMDMDMELLIMQSNYNHIMITNCSYMDHCDGSDHDQEIMDGIIQYYDQLNFCDEENHDSSNSLW